MKDQKKNTSSRKKVYICSPFRPISTDTYHFNPLRDSEKDYLKEKDDLPEGLLEKTAWPVVVTMMAEHRIENHMDTNAGIGHADIPDYADDEESIDVAFAVLFGFDARHNIVNQLRYGQRFNFRHNNLHDHLLWLVRPCIYYAVYLW